MKTGRKVLGLCFACAWWPLAVDARQSKLEPADSTYLRQLARDTWRCIADLADSQTGLPYDNSDRGEFTSVSNIGIYISCVASAEKLGLLSHEETVSKLKRAVTSLEQFKTWRGFQQSWNSVRTFEPARHDTAVSVLDSGNLAAGLVFVSHAVPELRARCQKLFKSMDWGWFYSAEQGALLGGYDTKKQALSTEWRLNALGTDAVLALFFAVATGQAPAEIWNKLEVSVESRYGLEYLKPGWQGGGLFMQYISGLWLDSRRTLLGRSARAFAEAQIRHGKAIGSPVWGWSACDDPSGGYLGWGGMKDDVVTPHASVLAIEHFPLEVLSNLRALERLGARSPKQGFYDSVNVKTGKKSSKFLVLDQGMLFLSLANFLDGDVVRKTFGKDPFVQSGRKRIPHFAAPSG